MNTLSIYIEPQEEAVPGITEVKYVFKTLLTIIGISWHFWNELRNEKVDIIYGNKPNKARLSIKRYEHRGSMNNEPLVTSDQGTKFLQFEKNEITKDIVRKDKQGNIQILNDIVYSSFYILSGRQEKFIKRKKRDVHILEDSFLYRKRLLHFPLVNQWAELLLLAFKDTHKSVPQWPEGKKFAIALSHDVDYPEMIRGIEVSRYVSRNGVKSKCSDILKMIKGKESFWRFEDWMDLEKKYSLLSAFYFCGFKGNLLRYFLIAPDPFYDVMDKRFKSIMKSIIEQGFEVGMHSSFLSYKNSNQFMNEKTRVERVLNSNVYGNRHHYWHFNQDFPYETAQIHAESGLIYDTSMGFEEHSGFRRGICSPYRLYHTEKECAVDVLQLPPCLMDSQLFHYEDRNPFKDYKEHIDSLVSAVKRYAGVFVVDFHVRVLNNLCFEGWSDAYIYLLEKLSSSSDYYCDTPINIARHWLDREKLLEAESKVETGYPH